MYPYLIRIGGLSIPSYPLLYGTGIAAAGAVAMWLGRREGLNARERQTVRAWSDLNVPHFSGFSEKDTKCGLVRASSASKRQP